MFSNQKNFESIGLSKAQSFEDKIQSQEEHFVNCCETSKLLLFIHDESTFYEKPAAY